jgi:hypothetical protein
MSNRRLPGTKEFQRQKKMELEAYFKKPKKADQVYVAHDLTLEHPDIIYVGTTFEPEGRFKAHTMAIRLGVDMKMFYRRAREVGIENIRFEVVDPEGEFSEKQWENILREQGHMLLNEAHTVDVMRKRPKVVGQSKPRTIEEHNEAMQRIMREARS